MISSGATNDTRNSPDGTSTSRKGFREKMYDFVKDYTENTSFHGVRYTFEAATCFGRSAWLVVVIGFFTWFCYQTIDRIVYFYKYPVVVDINIAYNESLRFPSIAICNTNQFKMTKAVEAGIYGKLEAFYGYEVPARWNATMLDDLDMRKTMWEMAHRKEDMIVMCSWLGRPCSHLNFTTQMTEFGICFIFNSVKDISDDEILKVQNTGASYGLELFLNAEMYELSPGPHLSSGIQVLPFDVYDRPRVSDLGQAIPVFAVSRLALQMTSLTQLRSPYGSCSSAILRDYRVYSFQACLAEANANKTAETCGCIGYGQRWHAPDQPPYCNLSTMYDCFADVKSRPIAHNCTHPCTSRDYSTSLSNTDLSVTSISSILDLLDEDPDLLLQYRKALLYRELVQDKKVEHDLWMLRRLQWRTNSLNSTQEKIRTEITTISNLLRTVFPVINELDRQVVSLASDAMTNFKEVFQYGALESYLLPELVSLGIRGWNLYERILPYSLKESMFKTDKTSKDTTERLIISLPRYFSNAIEIVSSVSSLFGEYVKTILNENKTVYSGITVPRAIIDTKKSAILIAIGPFNEASSAITVKMGEFQADASTLKTTMSQSEFTSLYAKLEKTASEVYDLQVKLKQKTQELFPAMQEVTVAIMEQSREFRETLRETKELLNILSSSTKLYKRVMNRYRVTKSERYFANLTEETFSLFGEWRNITKLKLIDILTPPSDVKRNMTQYMRGSRKLIEVLHSIEETKGGLPLIGMLSTSIKNAVSQVPALEKICTPLLLDLSKVQSACQALYLPIEKIQTKTDLFLDAVSELLAETVAFNETLKIDERMIKENILALQVFYQSMSYTDVAKKAAYDWFSLLGDIGGTAGLFLGGSFITILELLYYVGRRIDVPKDKKKKRRSVSLDQNSSNGQPKGRVNSAFALT